MSAVDRLEAGLNATGSLLSVFGTVFVLLSYIILPHKKHIRHAFIVNLTIADFINSVNNSVSGLIVLGTNHLLIESPSCTANGFIGQLSVQAVDCSILAITIVTWWTVTSKITIADLPLWKAISFCAASWVLPVITSSVALFKGYYGPVSTSWCWITAEPTYLRYVLTHGWRFIIIFVVSGLCIYIQIYLRRYIIGVTSVQHSSYLTPTEYGAGGVVPLETMSKSVFTGKVIEDDEEKIMPQVSSESIHEFMKNGTGWPAENTSGEPIVEYPSENGPAPRQKKVKGAQRNATEKRARLVQKTMLLNAYPIFYILLWIPGIANRIAEASGHPSYPLRIMQAATQFIGFANALTFGWNERILNHLHSRFRRGSDVRRWTID